MAKIINNILNLQTAIGLTSTIKQEIDKKSNHRTKTGNKRQ